MSKHNYSQYSNKNNNRNNNQNYSKPAVEVKEDIRPIKPVQPVMVNETVETVTVPPTVEGFVVNCAKLNVRENATVDSGIVCVLDATSEIEVDVNRSTSKWAYIYTATGLEGYCMREYIEAHL